jgi:starch phosphorylase
MNGALTIGTQDGANIEIRREVGAENFFMFGLTAPEVDRLRAQGYRPAAFYESNSELRQVIDLIREGFFSRGDPAMFRPIVDGLLNWDTYMLLADFQSYADCQAHVGRAYEDGRHWSRMSILNVARSGVFSSDRTIQEYADEIWRVPRVPIRMLSQSDLTFGPSQQGSNDSRN